MGNTMTAEYWEYDARLGRRWNIDPVVKPWESGYATFSNNPILFIDPYGLDAQNSTDPEDDKIYTSKEKLKTAEVYAERANWLKVMLSNFKYSLTSKEYRAKRRAQREERQTETLKNRGEYRYYGWSHEQNQAFSRFMLSYTLGYMTGGLASAYNIGGSVLAGGSLSGFPTVGRWLTATAGEYGSGLMVRGGMDFINQLFVNNGDVNKVDFADVAMSAVFSAKYLVILGSLLDFKGGGLQVAGVNKSLSDAGIDLVGKSIFGGVGIWGSAKPVLAPLKTPQLEFLFQFPITFSGKLATKMAKETVNNE